MKKSFAVLMLAAMLLSAGCGNNTADGVKKDAQEAQQKVEQKVDEAKSDAKAKVDEAKTKADEMKSDAQAKVNEAETDAKNAVTDAAQKLEDVTAMEGKTIALGGIIPGTATLDDVKAMLGEATAIEEDNEMTFVNDLKIKFDDAKKVKEISTTGTGFKTHDGVEVGMMEYALNDYCGPADKIEMDDGAVEYEYHSGDKKSKTVYTARNGLITEIKCTLND